MSFLYAHRLCTISVSHQGEALGGEGLSRCIFRGPPEGATVCHQVPGRLRDWLFKALKGEVYFEGGGARKGEKEGRGKEIQKKRRRKKENRNFAFTVSF